MLVFGLEVHWPRDATEWVAWLTFALVGATLSYVIVTWRTLNALTRLEKRGVKRFHVRVLTFTPFLARIHARLLRPGLAEITPRPAPPSHLAGHFDALDAAIDRYLREVRLAA